MKVSEERERCKAIVERKLNWLIEQRQKLKRRKGKNISQIEHLKEVMIFLIDNPDYENKT